MVSEESSDTLTDIRREGATGSSGREKSKWQPLAAGSAQSMHVIGSFPRNICINFDF